jgi:hypothetical protein
MVITACHRRRYTQARRVLRAGAATHRANPDGQNHHQITGTSTAHAMMAARPTQVMVNHRNVSSATAEVVTGWRKASRASRNRSRASQAARMIPAGVW